MSKALAYLETVNAFVKAEPWPSVCLMFVLGMLFGSFL